MSEQPQRAARGFTILGIPVKVSLGFFLMALLLGYTLADAVLLLVWVVVVGASILWHEMGHALVARHFGFEPSISLYAMGGLTFWTGRPTWKQRLLVSLAGPGAGFIAGAIVLLVAAVVPLPEQGAFGFMIGALVWVNLGWGALNLLPILPLDGGHALDAILTAFMGGRGKRVSLLVSVVTAAACTGLALWAGWTWAAIIAGFCGISSWSQLQSVGDAEADTVHQPRIKELWQQVQHGSDPQAVVAACSELLDRVRSDEARAQVLEMLGWALLQSGSPFAAAEAAARVPPPGASGALREALETHGPVEELASDNALRADWERAWTAMRTGDDAAAIALLEPVLPRVRSDLGRRFVRRSLAHAMAGAGRVQHARTIAESLSADQPEPGLSATLRLAEGDPPGAVDLVAAADPLPGLASVDLLSSRLFAGGHFAECARLGEAVFERTRRPAVAVNVACSYARLGRNGDALGWLESAVAAGWSDADALATDEDLAALKDDPGFAALLKGIG